MIKIEYTDKKRKFVIEGENALEVLEVFSQALSSRDTKKTKKGCLNIENLPKRYRQILE